ncbi:ATP-binding protein [Streptomyces sp. SID3343]|uniref:ATP-binding protein n=1 Tax=Streptomyces sp. SID3343 TaxID=2690260 RepID=UPI001368D691|nr:ATP-binding protein [Streptomyces sp. SID3343]MYW05311.1 ATP-binding protein [Streptomyces sp. SID3343]
MKPKTLIPDAHRPQLPPPTATFGIVLSSTPRGARLARLVIAERLADWNVHRDSNGFNAAILVVAELAGNAVRHCADAGWDFSVQVSMHPTPSDPVAPATLRIQVTDACPERPVRIAPPPPQDSESGRGLSLVIGLAVRWGCLSLDRGTKSVWADVVL